MTVQTVLNKAPATVQAGGVWDSINGGLNSALNVWAKVEQVKATRASTGQDMIQARTVPELENGAAVAVDQPVTSENFMVGGMKMNKNILYATGGILLAIIAFKKLT